MSRWKHLARGTDVATTSPTPIDNEAAGRDIKFHLLADERHWQVDVAGWLHREWYARRDMSLSEIRRLVAQRVNRSAPPLCSVAVREGVAVGTASLLSYEAPTVHPEPRCFLADVYVLPSARGQGVATALCRQMIAAARRLGLCELFVMTAGPQLLYKRLGWRIVDQDMLGPGGRSVTMMVLPLITEDEAGRGGTRRTG